MVLEFLCGLAQVLAISQELFLLVVLFQSQVSRLEDSHALFLELFSSKARVLAISQEFQEDQKDQVGGNVFF